MRRASQQRRIALLALIASAPSAAISRDRVLGTLWPERDERTARHLLADSLYVLRQTLGDDVIVASGETLRLSPQHVWCDVAEFHAASSAGRWTEALALYRGDFLDGFNLRNAVEFDQWAHAERTRLRAVAVRGAAALTQMLEGVGRLSDAIAVAERWLELATTDETAFRELVRLLHRADNRARAAVVARTFVHRLATELGIEPSPGTLQLVRDVETVGGRSEPVVASAARPLKRRYPHTTDAVTSRIVARGRHHWQQRTCASLERAISHFRAAADRDNRSVEAWCGLADSWIVMGGRGYVPVATAIDHAAVSLDRALAIDDTAPTVHTSIGGINILTRRWEESEAALRRAIQLAPHNANAHHWLSLTLLTGFGDRAAALQAQAISVDLNPIGSIQVGALGWQRYLLGEYELSQLDMKPAMELNPDFEEGHAGLARAAARLGDETGMMAAIASGLSRRRDLRGDLLAEQASALAVLGDVKRARAVAWEASVNKATPINLALAWASVGETDRAFACLEKESFLVYWAPHAVWWDPRFNVLRDDARFLRVRERVARLWSPEWSRSA